MRKLGVELVRTARELHRTLASPPQPSSKRSTMHHADGTGGAPAARRSSLQSGGGGGRRATQVHGGAYGAALPESLPVTPAGPRPAYVADIIDRRVVTGVAGAGSEGRRCAGNPGPAVACCTPLVWSLTPPCRAHAHAVGLLARACHLLLASPHRTGGTIVARCYWDFGRWSDLWRVWRPLPAAGATFEECLQRTRTQEASDWVWAVPELGARGAAVAGHVRMFRDGEHLRAVALALRALPPTPAHNCGRAYFIYAMQDHVRWARLLCELMREVWERSEKSAWPAHLELIAKLQVGCACVQRRLRPATCSRQREKGGRHGWGSARL